MAAVPEVIIGIAEVEVKHWPTVDTPAFLRTILFGDIPVAWGQATAVASTSALNDSVALVRLLAMTSAANSIAMNLFRH
jgi:hypothetical protein